MGNALAPYHYTSLGVLSISSGFFDLSVGMIVLLQNPRSAVNRSFFLVTLSAFLWVFGFGLMAMANQIRMSYAWASLAYIGIPFISPTVYIFSRRWRELPRASSERVGLAVAAGISIPFIFFPEVLFQFTEHPWGRYLAVRREFLARGTYLALISLFTAFAILAMRSFFLGWKTSTVPVQRIQFRNVLCAFVIAYVGSVDFAVKLGLNLYPSGCVWLSGLILVIAYTVLRYKAFNIDLAFKRLWLLVLIYSALVSLSFPILLPFFRTTVQKLGLNEALLLSSLSILGAAFLAGGPAIYTYIAGQAFWLKRHATSGLTHELKSPLGAIQGAADMLENAVESNNLARASEYVGMIQRNSQRLDAYVRELLTLLRIQDGALVPQTQVVALNKIIDEEVRFYEPIASQKGLSIVTELILEDIVEVDPKGISQVLSNVISNSVKFSHAGQIRIQTQKDSGGIRVSIQDDGAGIHASDLDRIFERFFQADKNKKGSGLGLAIAKGWVEAHGGRIWAESGGGGKGTTVSFTLPSRGSL